VSRAWNKETRNKYGVYYRWGDWSVDASRVEGKDNFTTTPPPQEAIDGTPCDWVDGKWVLDPTALAASRIAARAARYRTEADPHLLAYLGYQIEIEAGAKSEAKRDAEKAAYLAAKAAIRAAIPDA
jgi:hypothetical protein